MKKQKVLIVHNYYQVPGGEDTVVENEKNLLIENGHEVILYTRHNDEIKSKGILGKLVLPLETIFSLKTYNEVKEMVKNNNIDIVHVHNTLPLVSPSVYYAARKCNIPVVQTVHNFRLVCPGATFTRDNKICEECVNKGLICAIKNKCYRNSFTQSLVSVINLGFHRIIGTYKKVDGYIALTEFNKSKLSTLLESNKIFVKPNFVDFENEDIVSIDKRKYFLYLGRIDKLKGIDLILKAWKDIKDEELYIVGTGPFEEDAKRYVSSNNMKNVKFLGFRNKDEVKQILNKAKALIIASQCYEGFPMTILEAFSVGTPVIAGNIGNMKNIIKDNENGLLFKYNSSEDLVNTISKINCKNTAMKLSNESSKVFKTKYNKQTNYNELIKIYNTVGGIDEGM